MDTGKPSFLAAEILRSLGVDSPGRDQAAGALFSLLNRLAATSLIARNGQHYRIPEPARGDMVAWVVMKVLDASQSAPMAVAAKTDAECVAYLSTMLVNRWITEVRSSKVNRTDTRDDLDALHAPDREEFRSEAYDRHSIAAALVVLEKVLSAMLESRPEQYRGGAERAWSQLRAVTVEGKDLKTLVRHDEQIPDDAPPEELTRALNRTFKAHERLRGYLVATANDLQARREISNEERDLVVEIVVTVLLRCQRRPARGVSPGATTQAPSPNGGGT